MRDTTRELAAYIQARLQISAEAERAAIAATGEAHEVASEWGWVQDGKIRREATLALVKKSQSCTEHAEGLLMWIAAMFGALPPLTDRHGRIYTANGGGLVYLTDCCRATPTFSDDVLTCRACYEPVPEELLFTPDADPSDRLAPAKEGSNRP